jgi:glycosyltransferase involved in cell wall biosynthesis
VKRLLLVVPFFPPVGGIASLRATRFARYLPNYEWEPVVVTRKASRLTGSVKDPTLLNSLPSLRVVETDFLDLTRQGRLSSPGKASWLSRYYQHAVHLIPPDPWVGWVPFAYQACRRIITQKDIHAVVTQSPPLSTNLVGYALKRRYNLPWITDMLDEWTHHPGRKLRYSWQSRLDKRIETAVLKAADGVIVTTSSYQDVLVTEWGTETSPKVTVIELGYDREDFEGEIIPGNDKFTLAFVGSLDRLRKAAFHQFYGSVVDLITSGVLDKQKFCFKFVGHTRGDFNEFEDTTFEEITVRTGHLPHGEAVREMRKADALLLIRDTERKIAIPGKTFEYLATGRPILALVPREGATANLLHTSSMATIVDPADGKHAIAVALVSMFRTWQEKELKEPTTSPDAFACYEAAVLTRLLAEQLDVATQT